METNTQVSKPNTATIKGFFEQEQVKNRFAEMLGKRSNQFISSVLQITANNSMLKGSDPLSVYNSALMAATLDLPINQNLGFAWIVPYNRKFKDNQGNWQSVTEAQFQIGYKGLVQLAQRTGQYTSINVIEVYENQFESFNTLTEEIKADFSKVGEGKIVGYVAFFRLLNGFEKTCYWTLEKVSAHAKKYSKSFSNSSSPWTTNFDEMAKKTVLKSTLSKWGILSIEMQTAVRVDQAVIKDETGDEVQYVDHEVIEEQPEIKRLRLMIQDATTLDDLDVLASSIPEELNAEFDAKYAELTPMSDEQR